MKKFFKSILWLYKENGHIKLNIFGIKISFRNFIVNQLEDCCCIDNLDYFKSKGTTFKHPVGIVIHPNVEIGNNCTIYQNVTIGYGKKNKETNKNVPIIGDNVKIYSNAVVIGGITIGNNVKIGAGSVVINDVPDNTTVVGNPARIVD